MSHRVLLLSWVETRSTTSSLSPLGPMQGPPSKAGAGSLYPGPASPVWPAVNSAGRPSPVTQASPDSVGGRTDCPGGPAGALPVPPHQGDLSQPTGSDHWPPTSWFLPTECDSPNWSPRLLPCAPATRQRLAYWGPRDSASDKEGNSQVLVEASSGGEGKSSEGGLGVALLPAGKAGGGGATLCVEDGRSALP